MLCSVRNRRLRRARRLPQRLFPRAENCPTTRQSWKYTLLPFHIPVMFVLDPAGVGRLLKGAFGDTVLAMATEPTRMPAPAAVRKS